ncbi:glycine-rich domain-containing protein [Streptomyces zinciresistens]|uniref:glycine-rich domain-containing protein n=1 Tax=Streptomyces zinciresistens TaxID=1073330 RepID=UPI0002D68491|nr:hypothetical protein [Streptomyces zinciresistens]
MTATVNDLKTGRAVAGEELFESLTHFVVVNNGQSPDRAERIADQAVAFLVTAATANVPLVPSDDVDLGLHALILHTKEYARLCERYAGRFLHHNPKPGGGPRDLLMVITAARAMKAAGFMVFDDLWTVDGTNLAQCDSDCGRPYGQDYQE